MLQMLQDLVNHKGYANAAVLNAIRQNDAASTDAELLELLHHILLSNRFWLLAVLRQPFVLEDEFPARALVRCARSALRPYGGGSCVAQRREEREFDRILKSPLIPGAECSVAQALMQVCMHSHGHRAQAAKLLRRHGSTPPITDFILWLTTRARADWSDVVEADRTVRTTVDSCDTSS